MKLRQCRQKKTSVAPIIGLWSAIFTATAIFSIAVLVETEGLAQPQQQEGAADHPQFQWPMAPGGLPNLRGISSTFGESRVSHFHSGLDIVSNQEEFYPMAPGEILYSRDAADHPFQPEPGPGWYTIVDHGAGWWSGYYHLDRLAERHGAVDHETAIGWTGNSGHSSGPHLHFFLSRDYGRLYLNPLSYLPMVSDPYAPTIGQLEIATPQGVTRLSANAIQNIRLTQRYPIQVRIIDPGLERFSRRGPYRLEWQLNDRPRDSRHFEEIHFRNGEWLLGGRYSFESTFIGVNHNLGELPFEDGLNTLTITAADHAGNEATAIYRINVRREF